MSTPEHPDTPPLTRRQLREIRNTGATPVIDADALAGGDEASAVEDTPTAAAPAETPAPVAPLARPAEPVILAEPPGPDRNVDLGVSPLTRRQARQQERIRTASVPVITPEVAAAYTAETIVPEDVAGDEPIESTDDPFVSLGVSSGSAPIVAVPESTTDDAETAHEVGLLAAEESVSNADTESPRVLDPAFGAALLAGEDKSPRALVPSFDELITRSASGSIATPNALILSQSPDGGSLVAPVAATGEVLITGTLSLPEGLGSTGHAPGTADGKDVDAVLVDGELPAHSSPTPIAASAAISTVKTPGEIISPPAPEKGGRLMLTLAITAGVLALALVGVLILAFATGVFA